MMVRDTRGRGRDHAQRFNFFPAAPLCSVSCVLAGDCHVIACEAEMERSWTGAKMPPLSFSGAQPTPPVSWNPADTLTVILVFYPDALAAVTGASLAPFTGRTVGPRGRSTKRLSEWRRSLLARAARGPPGHGSRQIARRIKSWAGVSGRDPRGLGHTEELYARLHEAIAKGEVHWAFLAAGSGFVDQARMIRQLRRHTGFTPEALRRRARDDEALWSYRLLGEYFDAQAHGRR